MHHAMIRNHPSLFACQNEQTVLPSYFHEIGLQLMGYWLIGVVQGFLCDHQLDNEVLSKINLALVIKNYFKNWTKLGHCSISFENLFDPYNDLTNIQDIVCHPIFAECLISTRQLILHWIWLREYIHACVGVSVTLQECNSHYAIA